MNYSLKNNLFNSTTLVLLCMIFCTNKQFCSQMPDYSFSPEEYTYWMDLICEVNPTACQKLKKCAAVASMQCLEKYIDKLPEAPESNIYIEYPSEETHGYPILLVDPTLKNFSRDVQKDILAIYLDSYNKIEIATDLTANERNLLMKIVKSINPELYKEIVAIDPTGINHIKIHYQSGASVAPSLTNGLPIFSISPRVMKLPIGQIRFLIAHELGHYVLNHFQGYKVSHATLGTKQEGIINGKKISGQIPFEETFHYAFSRTQEYEADRFAVIDLGTNIADAIALAKRWSKEAQEHELKEKAKKETFKSTHPLWTARIKHFEELRREVDLRKAKKLPPKQINWKELAQDYLQLLTPLHP